MFLEYVVVSLFVKGVLAQASLATLEIQQRSIVVQRETSTETTSRQGPERALDGELVRATTHLDIYAKDSFVPVDMEWFAREAEAALSYVSERMGFMPRRRLTIAFRPPRISACPPRGLAYWNEPAPQLIVFADTNTSPRQLLGVLAHEMAHLLQTERATMRHTTLSEGLASWAAGKYWEAWQGTMVEVARSSMRDQQYVPLTAYYGDKPSTLTPEGDNCLRERDLRYASWGAFVEFLITNYGIEKMFQLLGPLAGNAPAPPAQRNAPPDFTGVYGSTLAQLEETWRRRAVD